MQSWPTQSATAPAPEQEAELLARQSLPSSIGQPCPNRTQTRNRPSKATGTSDEHPASATTLDTGRYGREAPGTPDFAGSTSCEAWNSFSQSHDLDGADEAGHTWSGSWNVDSGLHLRVSSGSHPGMFAMKRMFNACLNACLLTCSTHIQHMPTHVQVMP